MKQTREEMLVKKKAYYHAHKAERTAKSVEWGRKNKEKRKLYKDAWRAKNKEKTNFLTRQYNYRRKHAEGGISYADSLWLKSLFAGKCGYCRVAIGDTLDHILPLFRGGTNDKNNLLMACRSCNSSKGAKTIGEWKPIDAMTLSKLYGTHSIYGI